MEVYGLIEQFIHVDTILARADKDHLHPNCKPTEENTCFGKYHAVSRSLFGGLLDSQTKCLNICLAAHRHTLTYYYFVFKGNKSLSVLYLFISKIYSRIIPDQYSWNKMPLLHTLKYRYIIATCSSFPELAGFHAHMHTAYIDAKKSVNLISGKGHL